MLLINDIFRFGDGAVLIFLSQPHRASSTPDHHHSPDNNNTKALIMAPTVSVLSPDYVPPATALRPDILEALIMQVRKDYNSMTADVTAEMAGMGIEDEEEEKEGDNTCVLVVTVCLVLPPERPIIVRFEPAAIEVQGDLDALNRMSGEDFAELLDGFASQCSIHRDNSMTAIYGPGDEESYPPAP